MRAAGRGTGPSERLMRALASTPGLPQTSCQMCDSTSASLCVWLCFQRAHMCIVKLKRIHYLVHASTCELKRRDVWRACTGGQHRPYR